MRLALLFPLFLLGCPTDKADDTAEADADTDADTDSDTDADTDSDTDTDLPDVRDAMIADASGCEDVSGSVVPGGARYYWGEYLGNATDGWTGTEAVYVYANDTWIGYGGADCVSYWVTTATTTSTGACPTCELGLSITAVYDAVNSTCPEDMWGTEGWAESYAVDLDAGASHFYYAGSGTSIGVGYGEEAAGANFLSDRACVWF